jgi:predicted TPR repeat methyltransferase
VRGDRGESRSDEDPMSRNERRNPHVALSRAVELQRAGRLEEAETALREALARSPGFPAALHLLGLIRHARGDVVEAVALLERAVREGPIDADAWRNLGNLCVESGDLPRADACFREVLRHRPADVAARGNLATLLDRVERTDEAIDELRELLRRRPGETGALCLLARLLRKQRRHEEEVAIGHELVRLCPDDGGHRAALSRSYFLWFDAVDRAPEQARRVLDAWIAFDPDDPVARHMDAAHSGGREVPARASNAYVERHYDEFAATFDAVLGSLGYRGPELVAEALRLADPTPRASLSVADLGCGTGACGPLVRPWTRRLWGVDLSQKMLDEARKRRVYDELVQREMAAFLQKKPAAFDLVVCADALIYTGDLGPLFAALSRALAPGGLFIATAEVDEGEGSTFRLSRTGRYVHGAEYVVACLERAGLAVERRTKAELRREFATVVQALVVTARARAR